MKAAQANRARIAARASSTRPNRPNLTASPLVGVRSVVVTGPVKRTTCKSGAGSSSHGYGGPWAASADLSGRLGAVTKDSKWSTTVSSHG